VDAIKPGAFEVDPSFRGYIGIGRRDMTPQPGIYCHNWGSAKHEIATSIHRPLYASAVAFKVADDEKPFIVASLDYCWFQDYQTFHTIRRDILERLGLEDPRLLLVLSHSHSVPHIDHDLESRPGGDRIPGFRNQLITALRGAVADAVDTATPAILSWGRGHSSLARTRDYRDTGSGRIVCGPNPLGQPDSTVLVGRITDDPTGTIRGTIVNYACHPVSLGGSNTAISPDYVGAMRALVEQHTGGVPCIFLHGASGNQTPRYSYSADPLVADLNGEILGFAALSTLRALLPAGHRLEFSGIEQSGAELGLWESRRYDVDRTALATVQYLRLPERQWPSLADIDRQIASTVDSPTLTRLRRLRRLVINLHEGLGSGFPVWAIRLGQSVIIGTPAEPFVDLQVQLRQRFPNQAIIVTNDTNGSFNYLPPASYYGNGAYEQQSADFGPGALEIVIKTAAEMIESLLSAPTVSDRVSEQVARNPHRRYDT
jgi:hypothetical protein